MKPKLPKIQPAYGNFINGKFIKDWREKKGKRFICMGGTIRYKKKKTNGKY